MRRHDDPEYEDFLANKADDDLKELKERGYWPMCRDMGGVQAAMFAMRRGVLDEDLEKADK